MHDDEQLKVVLFGFDTGQELSEHTASKRALLYFVRGEAQLTLGSVEKTAQAGTYVEMEPNLPHSVKADSEVVMLLLMLH